MKIKPTILVPEPPENYQLCLDCLTHDQIQPKCGIGRWYCGYKESKCTSCYGRNTTKLTKSLIKVLANNREIKFIEREKLKRLTENDTIETAINLIQVNLLDSLKEKTKSSKLDKLKEKTQDRIGKSLRCNQEIVRTMSNPEAEISCAICLTIITGGENTQLTICGHKFHTKCLGRSVSRWGLEAIKCPICRQTAFTLETS